MKPMNKIFRIVLCTLFLFLISCDPWVQVHINRGQAILRSGIPSKGDTREDVYPSRLVGIIDSVKQDSIAVMSFYAINLEIGGGWVDYALNLKIKNTSLDTLGFDYELSDNRTDTASSKRKKYNFSVVQLAPNAQIVHRIDSIFQFRPYDNLLFSMKNLSRKK
jgi:hypothetical protein